MGPRRRLLAPLLVLVGCAPLPGAAGGPEAATPRDDAAAGRDDTSLDGGTLVDASHADSTRADAPGDANLGDAPPSSDLDEDGVRMLHPTKPAGETWRLGANDPNTATNFEVEQGTKVTPVTEGALSFWNVLSHPLNYASGGTGWTTRLHIYASGVKTQVYNWKTQKGWLATPADLKNQEYTVYARGHGVLDAPRLAFTLKIRGGRHTTDGDLASCTMMLLGGAATSGVARFGKELHHPDYDYVKLTPTSATSLTDSTWYGLKLVSYQRAGEPTQIHYELWIDRAPFDAAGKPSNGWEKFSEYLDVEGTSTGLYSKLADWGGMLTTFRTDGWHDLDFTLLSVREIVAP
ncbi:MAG: hypothetical protein NVSMB47_09490 [Polyangiales bacterium]